MARSGVNIRMKRGKRFESLDVIYDISDLEFKDWVMSKLDYSFGNHVLSITERYKVLEDMQNEGIHLYVDAEAISNESWWDKDLDFNAEM